MASPVPRDPGQHRVCLGYAAAGSSSCWCRRRAAGKRSSCAEVMRGDLTRDANAASCLSTARVTRALMCATGRPIRSARTAARTARRPAPRTRRASREGQRGRVIALCATPSLQRGILAVLETAGEQARVSAHAAAASPWHRMASSVRDQRPCEGRESARSSPFDDRDTAPIDKAGKVRSRALRGCTRHVASSLDRFRIGCRHGSKPRRRRTCAGAIVSLFPAG